jgi:hypothetical protein
MARTTNLQKKNKYSLFSILKLKRANNSFGALEIDPINKI